MKALIKFLIVVVVIITTNIKVQSQNYYLDVPNNIDDLGCGNWCWVHASLNVIHYYGDYFPSKMEIVEYARLTNNIVVDPSVTSCYNLPDSCCKKGRVGPMLLHWNIKYHSSPGILDRNALANEFKYNQPLIIFVSNLSGSGGEHFFIAHGIRFETVFILDASLGYCMRGITDIWPGKKWDSNSILDHSPNWSNQNNITGFYSLSKNFYSSNMMIINATLSRTVEHGTPIYEFHAPGNIDLYEGFNVSHGSIVQFY
jgi:hypothetical protein